MEAKEHRLNREIHNQKFYAGGGEKSPMNSDSGSYFGKLKSIDATSNGSSGSPRITTIR
jgi:hypothetical protein